MSKAKVITVHQPYAWAILAGLKRVENRTWSTSHRGRLVIHAGRRTERWTAQIAELREAGVEVPDADELTYSAILGEVELVDVVPYERDLLPDDYELAEDPWAIGPVCWILSNPRIYDEPIPCGGHPGIWETGGC